MGAIDDAAFPDPDELRAAAMSSDPLAALDSDHVKALYAAAATITTCVAEQTMLVVLAVKAGKAPSWLEYKRAVMQGRGISGMPRELGVLDRLLA